MIIEKSAQSGDFLIKFKHHSKVVTSYNYSLFPREEGASEIQGFDSQDVLYLITPDRFANGDTANDEITGMKEKINRKNKGGRHWGRY